MAVTDANGALLQTLSSLKSLAAVIAADLNDSGDISDNELSKIEESQDKVGILLAFLKERPADSRIHRRFANSFNKYVRQQVVLPILSTSSGVAPSTRRLNAKLRQFIDPNHGLLPHLVAVDVLDWEKYSRVKDIKNTYDKIDKLLEYFNPESGELWERFLESLEKTHQKHVVNYIRDTDHQTDDYPLDDRHMKLLRVNLPDLIDNLDVQDCMLVNELVQCGCITPQQKMAMQSEASSYEKNALLIDILARRSMADFSKFKKCLCLTNQPHLTKYLSDGGDIMIVDVELDIAQKRQVEEKIIDEFKRLLRETKAIPTTTQLIDLLERLSAGRRRELCDEMRNTMRISQCLGSDIELILLEIGHSIRAYFYCKTLRALNELLVQTTLRVLFRGIFTCLYDVDGELLVDELNIDKIRWTDADREKCVASFGNVENTDWSGLSDFPFEIQEMILIKSTVGIFVAEIAKETTDHKPEKIALDTMWTVCKSWWMIITNRKFHLQQLIHSFDEWRPYAKKLTCNVVKGFGDRQAFGIALCDGNLYVIENMLDTVTAYEATPPFRPIPHSNIQIAGLSPTDIVSFVAKKQLYITDPHALCVWQITLPDVVKQFVSTVEAWTLFVETNSMKLLATTHNNLKIYSLDDARLVSSVPLPARIDALHSVMTSKGRLFVSHTGSDNNNEFHQVSEVDTSGRVLQMYGSSKGNGPGRLYTPMYLALDGDERMFVADYFNGQVLVLSSELKLLRVLLKAEHFYCAKDGDESQFHDADADKPSKGTAAVTRKWPHRLQYIPSTRTLLVALNNGAVNVCILRKGNERHLNKIWGTFRALQE